jgi:hypothetical protein
MKLWIWRFRMADEDAQANEGWRLLRGDDAPAAPDRDKMLSWLAALISEANEEQGS